MKDQVELPKEHRDWSERPLGVFWFCLCVCFCLLLGEEAGPNPNLLFLLLDEISKPWLGIQQPLISCFCPLVFKSHTPACFSAAAAFTVPQDAVCHGVTRDLCGPENPKDLPQL